MRQLRSALNAAFFSSMFFYQAIFLAWPVGVSWNSLHFFFPLKYLELNSAKSHEGCTDPWRDRFLPILAGTQGQVGWSPGQPDLIGGSLAHGRGLELGDL